MTSVLRSLGWALSIFAGIGSLLVYVVSQDAARQLFVTSVAIAVGSFMASTVLDIAARDDLGSRQKRAWLLVIVLGAPPVGTLVYVLLGRRRTSRWLRAPSVEGDARRVVHWRYAVGDPFHRDLSLTARARGEGSAPGSSPRTPPTRRT